MPSILQCLTQQGLLACAIRPGIKTFNSNAYSVWHLRLQCIGKGLSNATDLFETCIHEILQGLNGCTNIADDILVFGTTYEEFKSNVISFLDCCVEEDMHLNPDKVKIDCPEVPFFRNILSKDGLSPDTKKVELIQQWPTPTNHKELQSFLGTINYLSRF